jgi:haloalkane dehalogenase
MLLAWGLQDPTFGPQALARWRAAFPQALSVEFPESGHFVLEESPEDAVTEAAGFLEAGVSRRE